MVETNEVEWTEDVLPDLIRQRYGVEITVDRQLAQIQHTFSHLQWTLHVYLSDAGEEINTPPTIRFVRRIKLGEFTFSVAHHKIIEAIRQKS